MPLYEYECTSCHRRLEKIQKFSDADLTVCPTCGGALERTITAAAVSFKGGGWYKDGYASVKPAGNGADASVASPATNNAAGESSTSNGSSDTGSSSSSTESAKPAPAATPAPAAASKA